MLSEPGPWLAAVIALAVFSPVLIWNASHHWVSLQFQGGRAVPHHLGVGLFFSLLGAQIVVLLPGALLPLAAGVREALTSRRAGETFLLWLGLPIAALFTFIPLMADNGMMQWAMPGWLMLMPLAGKFLEERSRTAQWPTRLMIFAAGLLLALTLGAGVEYRDGWLGAEFPHLFRHGDPTADNTAWSPLSATLLGQSDKRRDFVLTLTWRDAAKIDNAIGGKMRVFAASDDPRNFAIGLDPDELEAQEGWIVLRTPLPARLENTVRHCFQRTAQAATLTISRNSRPDASLIIFRGDGFSQRRCGLVAFDQ